MNSAKLTVKDSSLAFLVGFLLCQIAVVVGTCLIFIVYKICKFDTTLFSAFFYSAIGYMLSSLFLYLTMLAIFFFFNKNRENKITKPVQLKKILQYILISIFSFAMLYPIVVCVDSLLVKCGFSITTLPYTLTTKNYFISLISLVLLPAVCEELLFRGIIFPGLKKHGKTLLITITALMFCLFHMSISQTIYPMLMGLLLCVIMFHEENIYYCITVHMTNNFLSLTLSYFKINLVFNHWTYIILAIVLFGMFLAIILTLIILAMSKTEKIYLFSSLGIMLLLWILTNII